MNKLIPLMVGLFFLAIMPVSAQIMIKTTLDKTTLVADGKTEYRMRVWADTTAHPEIEIVGAEWDSMLPRQLWSDYIVVTRAELPGQNDFFEGWDMLQGWNRVDGTPDGNGELTDNVRLTDDPFHGPSNSQGYLGEYYFKVLPGYTGMASFDLNDIEFVDSNVNQYRTTNGWVIVENQEFEVVRNNPFWVREAGERKPVSAKCIGC